MTTTPDLTASDEALAELRALLGSTPRPTSTLQRDLSALRSRVYAEIGQDNPHLTTEERAYEFAQTVLTVREYSAVSRAIRVALTYGPSTPPDQDDDAIACQDAMRKLTAQEYRALCANVRRRDEQLTPGLDSCAAHLRGDCHDSTICPICKAGQSGMHIGERKAYRDIACG